MYAAKWELHASMGLRILPTGSLLGVHTTISASEPDSKMVFLVEMA
jgi:hypothetical protein